MLIRDVMTIYPIYININSSMHRAAEIVSIAEVSDLMVVDDEKTFVGVLSEGDMIRAVLPNFDEVIAAGGSLADAFAFFVRKGRELARRPIAPLVITDPITMKPTDEAALAATVMAEKQIRRLPVVDDHKLVGSISRADICRAVIYYGA
ncbi:MAG TPA: CBS domain-containing protein [Thermomicrobiaceae bacterium]|nr:CBS domain-containing protein [Thermomicrobiaceae bacterium]